MVSREGMRLKCAHLLFNLLVNDGKRFPTADTAVANTRPKSAITVNVNGIPISANSIQNDLPPVVVGTMLPYPFSFYLYKFRSEFVFAGPDFCLVVGCCCRRRWRFVGCCQCHIAAFIHVQANGRHRNDGGMGPPVERTNRKVNEKKNGKKCQRTTWKWLITAVSRLMAVGMHCLASIRNDVRRHRAAYLSAAKPMAHTARNGMRLMRRPFVKSLQINSPEAFQSISFAVNFAYNRHSSGSHRGRAQSDLRAGGRSRLDVVSNRMNRK